MTIYSRIWTYMATNGLVMVTLGRRSEKVSSKPRPELLRDHLTTSALLLGTPGPTHTSAPHLIPLTTSASSNLAPNDLGEPLPQRSSTTSHEKVFTSEMASNNGIHNP